MRWFLTVLFALYPKKRAEAYTKEGDKMRLIVAIAVAAHCIFFMVCFLFVGIYSSGMNLSLALWSFSLYLTLDIWKIYLYILFLIACIFYTIAYQFAQFQWNLKFGGLVMNVAFYVLLLVLVIRTYSPFSATGGLYGITGKKGSNSHDSSSAKIFNRASKGLKKGE